MVKGNLKKKLITNLNNYRYFVESNIYKTFRYFGKLGAKERYWVYQKISNIRAQFPQLAKILQFLADLLYQNKYNFSIIMRITTSAFMATAFYMLFFFAIYHLYCYAKVGKCLYWFVKQWPLSIQLLYKKWYFSKMFFLKNGAYKYFVGSNILILVIINHIYYTFYNVTHSYKWFRFGLYLLFFIFLALILIIIFFYLLFFFFSFNIITAFQLSVNDKSIHILHVLELIMDAFYWRHINFWQYLAFMSYYIGHILFFVCDIIFCIAWRELHGFFTYTIRSTPQELLKEILEEDALEEELEKDDDFFINK